MSPALFLLTAHLLAAPGVLDDEPGRSQTSSTSTQALTRESFNEPTRPPLNLGYELALLPERVVRMAVQPLRPIVSLIEEEKLEQRLIDLLVHDHFIILPIINFVSSTGFAAGALIMDSSILGGGDDWEASALVQANSDRSFSGRYRRIFPSLDGRIVGLAASYYVDNDERFFGIGGNTKRSDESALFVEQTRIDFDFEILGGPGVPVLTLGVVGSLIHRYMREGVDPELPPVQASGGLVEPPPGFRRAITYPQISLNLQYDVRDTGGPTNEGFVLNVRGLASQDLNGEDQSVLGLIIEGALFAPVLPRARTLMILGGAGAMTPYPGRDDVVPLHGLISLGGSSRLRGFRPERFRDQMAYWASAEYRYPIWDYGEQGAGLSSTLFIDWGRVGKNIDDLTKFPPKFSGGFGVRIEYTTTMIMRIQAGFSDEGAEFIISINDVI